MKYLNKILFLGLFFILQIVPVIALIYISKEERKQYEVSNDIVLEQLAYGHSEMVTRREIPEIVKLNGVVVSAKKEFVEIGNNSGNMDIRLLVAEGDYINKEQLIAYIGNKPIYSDKSGIICSVNLAERAYLVINSTDSLLIEGKCTKSELNIIKSLEKLFDEAGNEYTLGEINEYLDEDNMFTYFLYGDDLIMGEQYKNMCLYTGKVFSNVLVVDKNCVYSKDNSEKKYIRVIDENNIFVEERSVSIGGIYDPYVVIDGAEEGTLCDSGYKKVVEKDLKMND